MIFGVSQSFDQGFKPDAIIVDGESDRLKTSAKILFTADAPEGTNIVHATAEEIDDLTGNVFEKGYEFGYRFEISGQYSITEYKFMLDCLFAATI